MASSSTSSIQKIFKYDVFLSFRGEDTRNNFVGHLYDALKRKSIQTYKDDEEINKGKKISDELIKSIEDSKFYIIVFSKNYASSSWCLDELVKIMECQTRKDQTAYPVFYDVEPREVRNQIGAVGEAFAKHENAEAAGKWRGALKEAADLAGWELKATFNGQEAKFIKKIVEDISLEIRPIWSVTDGKLVGMETRVKDVVSSIEIGYDDVRMIGIKGIGGGGKTTLARAVFDNISAYFEGQSFVENVREASKASLYGLKSLQKQVLSDVLQDQSIVVNNVYDGKNMMKRMMLRRKVLLVLDDVDHIDQLEALAGETNWFKPGSRIIITTRDAQVLIAHGVNIRLDVNLLLDEEAFCLFSRYAFGREIPIEGYEEFSTQVVRYAAGLPLTMRVLGSYLCGKDNLEWENALERLKKIPLEETLQKLEISYKGLEDEYKEIFLDVACLLKGWPKDEAIKALESQGFYARNGLRVLEQKSLITISEFNRLNMHDHIEEMGKNIVRRLHPDEPWRHSRLWIEAEIKDILEYDQGTEETRGILLRTFEFGLETYMGGLRKMKKLRFLVVRGRFDDDYGKCDRSSGQYLPNSLRYLRWKEFPHECLPRIFLANNLVTLVMHSKKIVRLWEEGERKALNKLRFLNLRCKKLMTFDFELTPNLETLDLQHSKLVKLHMPVECPNLKYLNLDYNLKLRNLTLGLTPILESLSLERCDDLVELHMPYRYPKLNSIILTYSKLKTLELGLISDLETSSLERCDAVELHMPVECPNLKYLNLDNSKTLRNLTLGSTPNLEQLGLNNCFDLIELHMPYRYPKLNSIILTYSKLKTLELGLISDLETSSLERCDAVELHMPVEFPNLKYLNLDNSKTLRNLTLGSTPNLEQLGLNNCFDLVELHMPYRYPKLKSIYLRCSKLKTLELGLILDLETSSLERCDAVELHMPVEFPNLKYLYVDYNSTLRNITLGSTLNLESLSLIGCVDLVELHMPYRYPKLNSIILTCSKLKTLELGLILDLETSSLERCDVVEPHMPVECPNLEYLNLDNNSMLRNLTLGSTPSLESLSLIGCDDLVELHMPYRYSKLKSIILGSSKLKTLELGLISDLETLSLEGCGLVELHMPVDCPNLKYLNLNNNSTLRNLTLGSTPNLESLNLKGCGDLVELHMPYRYPKLKSIYLRCSKLKTLELGLILDLETLIVEESKLVELFIPGECPNLKYLYLNNNSTLRNLTLGSTLNLELLSLIGCVDLVELHMPYRYPKLNSIILTCTKLKTLELGLISDLEKSSLERFDVVEPHMPVECPNLKYLNLDNNSTLRNLTLGSTPDLEMLSLAGCCDLVELHMPYRYSKLNSIILGSSKLKTLELGLISDLETLSLEGCDWVELHMPKDLYQLNCLKELSFSNKEVKSLPDSLCMLKQLKSLRLKSCWLLDKLPEDLGLLECLEEIIITDCIFLRCIPNSICKMKRLKYLHLAFCILVEKLPEELGRLESLKELNIEGTGVHHLPLSIFRLKGLCIVGSKWRLQSYGFTSVTQTSEYGYFCYI